MHQPDTYSVILHSLQQEMAHLKFLELLVRILVL